MFLGQHNILAPKTTSVTVAVEPVRNLLNSLSVLGALESNPGVDEWAMRTASKLPAEAMRLHNILFYFFGTEALANLIPSQAEIDDFPAYIHHVESLSAVELRDRLLEGAFEHYAYRIHADYEPFPPVDLERVIADRDYWMDYVSGVSHEKAFTDLSLFSEAHGLFSDPPLLRQLTVDILWMLWTEHLRDEWERVRPIIQQSVDALSRIDTSSLSIFEAIRQITGRNLHSILNEAEVAKFEHIRLIPSKHNGPYITTIANDHTLWLVFGARIPAEMKRGESPLDHVELLNRLRAMGDETRLNILIALRRSGELSTGQIMETFDLDKSAASRHLRNLHASGLIVERRDPESKGKLYSLSNDGLTEMLNTVHMLLA
jgi:DNA-binding transcriptional ArsR family regulator